MARVMTVSPVGSVRHDSGVYRGDGEPRRREVFRRSADGTSEAAICSIIEPNNARTENALSGFQIPVQLVVQTWKQTAGPGLSWI